jgi:hypothetical protein
VIKAAPRISQIGSVLVVSTRTAVASAMSRVTRPVRALTPRLRRRPGGAPPDCRAVSAPARLAQLREELLQFPAAAKERLAAATYTYAQLH